MKKKIAVFVNSLEIGGTESVTLVFVNELIKYNFTVDLILLQKKGYYLKFLDKRVNVVNLNKKRLLYRVWLNAPEPRPMAPEFANQLNTGERGGVTKRL